MGVVSSILVRSIGPPLLSVWGDGGVRCFEYMERNQGLKEEIVKYGGNDVESLEANTIDISCCQCVVFSPLNF